MNHWVKLALADYKQGFYITWLPVNNEQNVIFFYFSNLVTVNIFKDRCITMQSLYFTLKQIEQNISWLQHADQSVGGTEMKLGQ